MVTPYATIRAILAERGTPASIMPVTNLLERLNEKIKRRTHVVRIFPTKRRELSAPDPGARHRDARELAGRTAI